MGGVSSLEKSVAIIPKVGGSLSLIACTLIMRDVILKWHKKRDVPLTSIIVFFISVMDWLYSFFCAFMSTWMIPTYTGFYLAFGNVNTCTAQGFITAIALAASMGFYAVLMILYLIITKYGWTDRRMKEWRVRLGFILPPIIISIGLALPPLFLGMYNYGGSFTCFIAAYPEHCDLNPEVDCIRGQGAYKYWDVYWTVAILYNLVIITSVSILIYSVFKQESKTDSYLLPGQEKRRGNTRQTVYQGIRYISAFTITYLPVYIIMGYKDTHKPVPVGVTYMLIILTPLLGLFNSIVYFRPRYILYRKKNPDAPRIVCFSNVFNIDLDLEGRRPKMSSKLPTLMRKNKSGSGNRDGNDLARPLCEDGAERNNSSISNDDLGSPLYEDHVEGKCSTSV